MMGLPDSVQVGHLRIKVRTASRAEAERMDAPAWFDDDALEICVREDLPPAVRAECMTHELLHALMFASDNHGLTGEQEERVVRALSPFVVMFLRDNPALVADMAAAVT